MTRGTLPRRRPSTQALGAPPQRSLMELQLDCSMFAVLPWRAEVVEALHAAFSKSPGRFMWILFRDSPETEVRELVLLRQHVGYDSCYRLLECL